MPGLHRRLILLTAILVLLVPLLAACGGTPDTNAGRGAANPTQGTESAGANTDKATPANGTGSRAGGKTTLTFWNGFTGPDRPAVEGLVKRWNDTHPDVQVKMDITPWDTLLPKLPSALSTGKGPDLFGVTFQYMPQYDKSGYIKDLSSEYQKGGDLDPENLPEGLVEVLKRDGKFYGAPMNFATLMMYYNKDMFKQAGLDPEKPPKTWDEWIAAAKKLTRKDKRQYAMAIGEHETIPNWPILLWGNGGDVVKNGKPALTDPKTVEALRIWGNLVKDQKISPTGLTGAEADKLFQTQKAAMNVTGPWMTSGFTEAGLNFDVAPVPAGPAGPVTLADSVLMMVNAKSKNADAAVEFIKFWNSKESQIYWSQQTGFPTARRDLVDNPELAKNKWVPKFTAVAKDARFYLPGQEKFAQINDDVFVPMIQNITYGRKSVEESTKEANQKLEGLVK